MSNLGLIRRALPAAVFILMLLVLAIAQNQSINLVRANPYLYHEFGGDVPPDSKTKPPIVSIVPIENITVYQVDNISFALNVSVGDSNSASSRFIWKIYYKSDWQVNNTYVYEFIPATLPNEPSPVIAEFSSLLNLTEIPEGKHNLAVYAWERGSYENHTELTYYYYNFNINGASSIFFIVDKTFPMISFLLENKTFYSSGIPLDFTVNEPFSVAAYSLDGQANVSIAGNTTLTGLPYGTHNLTIYANDIAGNMGASKTVAFTVAKPEQFPTTIVIVAASGVSVVIVGIGVFCYFKKHKN